MRDEKAVLRSIELARRMAEREARWQKLQEMRAPDLVIANAEKSIASGRNEMIRDLLAYELMPQARERVRMEKEREHALEATVLGQLFASVDNLADLAERGQPLGIKELDSFSHDKIGQYNRSVWQEFVSALIEGKVAEALDALSQLLRDARIDLLFRELPPAPPPMEIEGKKYPWRHYAPEELE